MFKYLLVFSLVFVGFITIIQAQENDPFADIVYPIAELGNCANKNDCLNYCDDPDNMAVCLNFAEENNLMPKEDIEMGKKMLAAGETAGPGGCRGQRECSTFCDDISNIKECVAFAKEHNLIPADELAEAEKVIAALDKGIEMPPCKSKSECDIVCKKPENIKVCITFAKEAGLMPPEELEEVEKVLAAIEKGAVPPPCGGKDECEEYCAVPENFEQCITFAEAAGFVSSEEAAMIRKTGGQGPGGCRGKEQCETYCDDPANMEPCINFAIEFGFMSTEEGEQAKKMMAAGFTSGPGGCQGKEECEAFCDNMANMEECVSFAERAGMMSPEDAARARKMAEMGMAGGPGGCKGEEECRSFCEDPANSEECINFAMQIGEMSPEEADQARKGMEIMQRGGPGGCTSEQGCRAYCEDPSHGEECVRFSIEAGMMSPEEAEGMLERMEMMKQGPQEFQEMMEEGKIPEDMIPEGVPPEMQQQIQQQIEQQIQQETERRIQEQIQQQYQQQMEQQMQQMMPPPTTEQPPQSFWDRVKNFLAGAGLIIEK